MASAPSLVSSFQPLLLADTDANDPMSDVPLSLLANHDLSETFLHMEYRKLQRITSASYEQSPWYIGWVTLYCLMYGCYFVVMVVNKKILNNLWSTITSIFEQQPFDWSDWKDVLLLALLAMTLAPACARMHVTAAALCVAYLYMGVCVVLYDYSTFWIVVLVVLVLYAITWFAHWVYFYPLPWLVKKSSLCFAWRPVPHSARQPLHNNYGSLNSATGIFREDLRVPRSTPFASDNNSEITYQYMSIMSWDMHYFTYKGAISDGKPHGWGVWRDDSYHGEALVGLWHHGVPVGPFESLERGTGNVFKNVTIGFFTGRDDWLCIPQHERGSSIHFGLAHVECSITGIFYAGFPRVQFEPESKYPTFGDMLQDIVQYDPLSANRSVIVSATPDGLYISNYRPLNEKDQYVATISCQPPSSSTSDTDSEEEESELSGPTLSTTISGQEQVPVSGSSPSLRAEMVGKTPSPLWSSQDRIAAEGGASVLRIDSWTMTQPAEALIYLHGYNSGVEKAMKKLGQLLATGRFPEYIKPILFSWPTGKVLSYWCAIEEASSASTCHEFEMMLIGLREAGITTVHLFAHSMGIRVFLSAFNACQSMFKYFTPKIRTVQPPSAQMELRTVVLCNPDYPLRQFRDVDFAQLYAYCHNITLYVDSNDGALFWSEFFTRVKSIGRLACPLYANSSRDAPCLDVDVIDASGLQQNVHSVRHSSFHVNRAMVEDIREVIVSQTRASARILRLVRKNGNFYSFMTTPSSVTGSVV